MIHREYRDSVTILRMERGKVNAIDTELFIELIDAFDEVEQSPAKAVVFTGAGRAFSAGVDLFRVLEGGRTYLETFLRSLTDAAGRIFMFPKPVVAAINGHAIAGACILACACDYRIMAEGSGKIGVPELRVGVPYPALALEILRFAVARSRLQELMYTGNTYSPEGALERGLIDEIVRPDRLLDRACELAEQFGAIPHRAFQLAKQQLRRPTWERFNQYAQDIDPEVLDLWSSPDTQAAIRQYLERTIGKSG